MGSQEVRPKAAGDRASDVNLLEEDLDDVDDNLINHIGQLAQDKQGKEDVHPLKRRLTVEEKNELRGT